MAVIKPYRYRTPVIHKLDSCVFSLDSQEPGLRGISEGSNLSIWNDRSGNNNHAENNSGSNYFTLEKELEDTYPHIASKGNGDEFFKLPQISSPSSFLFQMTIANNHGGADRGNGNYFIVANSSNVVELGLFANVNSPERIGIAYSGIFNNDNLRLISNRKYVITVYHDAINNTTDIYLNRDIVFTFSDSHNYSFDTSCYIGKVNETFTLNNSTLTDYQTPRSSKIYNMHMQYVIFTEEEIMKFINYQIIKYNILVETIYS